MYAMCSVLCLTFKVGIKENFFAAYHDFVVCLERQDLLRETYVKILHIIYRVLFGVIFIHGYSFTD